MDRWTGTECWVASGLGSLFRLVLQASLNYHEKGLLVPSVDGVCQQTRSGWG